MCRGEVEGPKPRTHVIESQPSAFDSRRSPSYVPPVRHEYAISLRGLRFHARIGILPHERELPQPIEVDVTVWPRPPHDVPAIGKLLDYRALYDHVAQVVNGGPIDFLEGLALAIAERTMSEGNIRRVRVAARKPHVLLPGPVAHAEVVADLTRDD